METTREARPRRASRRRESGGADRSRSARDQYDLLTAMLMGVAVGAAATLLVRTGSQGATKLLHSSGSKTRSARRWAGRRAKHGARWVNDRKDDLRDKLPSLDDVSGELKDYLSAARDTISDTVSDELRDFRKAIRRQRKRIGV